MSSKSTAVATKPPLPKHVEEERRRSPRMPKVVEAWLRSPTATDPDDKFEVTAVNLSRHGVAFDHTAPLPVGAFYVFELGHGEQKMACEVRTNRCDRVADHRYEVGAEFC